jgi:hypothetical protein
MMPIYLTDDAIDEVMMAPKSQRPGTKKKRSTASVDKSAPHLQIHISVPPFLFGWIVRKKDCGSIE